MTTYDELADWDDARLARLLTLRPDLHEARNLLELARLVSSPGALLEAVEELPAPQRQVLEAVVLTEPRTPADLAALDEARAPQLAGLVADLQDRFLLAPGSLRPVGTVAQHLPHPLGLGRPAVDCFEHTSFHELCDLLARAGAPRPRSGHDARLMWGEVLQSADVDALPPDVLALLRRADADGPVLRMPGVDPFRGLLSEDLTEQRAVVSGLLAAVGVGRVELPQELGLALRRPSAVTWLPLSPVDPTVEAGDVGAACSTQVARLLSTADALLSRVAERPLPLLASGSVGVKELRAVGQDLGDLSTVTTVLVLLQSAGMVAAGRKDVRVAAGWASEEPARRWEVLVDAWLRSTTPPVARPGGKAKAALGLSWDREAPLVRRQLVRLVATVPSGSRSPDGWLALWRYRWPERRLTASTPRGVPLPAEQRADVLHEATVLGLLADGAATPLVEVLHGGRPAEEVFATLGERGETTVKAQADLTLVCTGRPARAMQVALDRIAAVEQSGAATVWRISELSLSRAFDEGDSPQDVLDVLARHAGTVPQGMSYLVGDAHRRHGRVLVGAATSYVVVDDDARLVDALRGRTGKLAVRRIAPGVAVSSGTVTQTVAALRALGLAAVAETTVPVAARRAATRVVLPVLDRTPEVDQRVALWVASR